LDSNFGILIVEDSFLTAEGYRTILAGAGFSDVRLAAGPDAALREAAHMRPALAIVDLQFDVQRAHDGLDLADALLRGGVSQVIIATGYRPALVDAGRLVRPPAAILQKPVLAGELLDAVRRCLPAAPA
jgi:DNA-binding response OmpR family regulator